MGMIGLGGGSLGWTTFDIPLLSIETSTWRRAMVPYGTTDQLTSLDGIAMTSESGAFC